MAGFKLISLLEAHVEDEASLSVGLSTASAGRFGRIGIFGNNTLGSVAVAVVEGLGDDGASLLSCFKREELILILIVIAKYEKISLPRKILLKVYNFGIW